MNKGTTTLGDWRNNIQQLFGTSTDMQESITKAKYFATDKKWSSYEITFIGHSKGGAEAAANAVATNRNCIIFNPATVNLSAYDLNSDGYSASMTAYIVKGEALNIVFGGISTPIDKAVYLPRQSWNPVANHLMSAVKAALKEAGY